MSTRFHSGEMALQEATGARERMGAGNAFIRDFMPGQHRELFAKLPTLFVATLDADGRPWASVVAGSPGFLSTPDERSLVVGSVLENEDPAAAGLRAGRPIGVLGIEPHTRRRNRANGVLDAVLADRFVIEVRQSFGNCPKYIYARQAHAAPGRKPGRPQLMDQSLDDDALQLIHASDTLFIASSSAARFSPGSNLGYEGTGLDVSHRGGLPGFVSIDRSGPADRLTIPDYIGNFVFNTLGNLLLWPRAGLLFIDWREGHVLQLAVDVELQTEGEGIAAIPGAQRLVHMTVVRGAYRPHAHTLTWSEPTAPPQFVEGSPLRGV